MGDGATGLDMRKMRPFAGVTFTVATLMASSAAFAATRTITFGGTIINDATQAQATYLAEYTYNPSQGDVTTRSEQGGLVSTNYTGPVQTTITFNGSSYVINDIDSNSPGDVDEAEETQTHPPSFEYIADANSDAGSIINLVEVEGRKFGSGFGAYDQLSNGVVTAAYTLIPDSVSDAPEPTTWLLMIAGVSGAGLMLRQAKRKIGSRFKVAVATSNSMWGVSRRPRSDVGLSCCPAATTDRGLASIR